MSGNDDHISKIRHSLAHLLAAAVLELYPEAKPTIGPAIDNGFYYDFDCASAISDKDLARIEDKMKEIVKSWQLFEDKTVTPDEAQQIFKGNPYKLELIREISAKNEVITIYTSGNFTDLCRGGHVDNPSAHIPRNSWRLDKVAGAYWKGDEKNKMLLRIYGLAFSTKDELDEYSEQREEAKKRDHKKLGKELDLFTFSDLIGGGLPLWTPKGTLMRDLLDSYVWQLRQKHGYVKVDIPHITKKDLYEKSGHWDKFQEELFKIKTREKHEFVMKPMSCPHHTQIFARKPWSYRDLPQRYAETTKVYRDEQSGELAGLSRVRAITQDDAHVFCRSNDVKNEMSKIWDIIAKFYGAFGFELSVRISLHDPDNMDKYLGDEETWIKSENELRELVKEKKSDYTECAGEAAFYGPKIDFMGKDALGREHQVATIQLDMNLPERFDLFCINEKGDKERIVMIHAAIMGSIERFLSIIIEHFAGAFPLWLSPVQISILAVSDKHTEAAGRALEELNGAGIRAELTDPNISIGKRVREIKMQKIPYWIVIGDKEASNNSAALEHRESKLGTLSIEDVISKLRKEIVDKTL